MKIGYLGLGKMGKNMVLQMKNKGLDVVAWNRSSEPLDEVAALGVTVEHSLEKLVLALPSPRVLWLMLPSGEATSSLISTLSTLLHGGDLVVDASNGKWEASQEYAKLLQTKSIEYIDVGVSGGPSGARDGACIMAGGTKKNFLTIEKILHTIAAPNAVQHFEGVGAGHFVKMVHNGIEYGMMQAIAEGFEVLKKSPYDLNLIDVASIYNNRSVIESRLVGWLLEGYRKYGVDLEPISGSIGHLGEGLWTVQTAKKLGVPTPIIEGSFNFRIESQKKPSYTGRVVSLLRTMFGGHKVTI